MSSKYVIRLDGATINAPDFEVTTNYNLINPNLEQKNYALLDPKLSLEFGSAGSLEFTIPPTHPLYYGVFDTENWNQDSTDMEDQLSWTRGTVTVEEDGDYIFAGRVYSYEIDMYKRKHMVFEGALNFFHDSIQPPAEYDGWDMEDFIDALIANHNVQVKENRRFVKGHLGMANGQKVYRRTDYEDTWTCLQNYVIDTIGGYFAVRVQPMFADPEYAGSYELYLDYYNQTTVVFEGKPGTDLSYTQDMYNSQVIEFQQNLLDISESFSMDDIFTRLIPLGQTEVNKGGNINDTRSLDELSVDDNWRSKYGIVLTDSVNVYEDSKISSGVITTIPYETRFQYVETNLIGTGNENDLWFHIKVDDITGYVLWTMDRSMRNNLGSTNEAVSYPHVPSRNVYSAESWTTAVYYDGEGLMVHPRDGSVAREGPGREYRIVTYTGIENADGVYIKTMMTDRNNEKWFFCYVGSQNFYMHESGFYLPNDEVLSRYVDNYSSDGKIGGDPIFTGGTSGANAFTAYKPGDLNQIDNRLTIAEVNNGSVVLTLAEAASFEEWYEEKTGEFLNGDPILTGDTKVLKYPYDTGGLEIITSGKKKKKAKKVKTDSVQKELIFTGGTNSFEERFGIITKVQVFSNATSAIELKQKGSKYLLDHARNAVEISVSSADLSMINTDFAAFKIGQFVPIKFPGWSSRFSWNTSPVWTENGSLLRILKLEINMDTGEKRINLGTQKRKDLTEITKEVDEEAKNKGKKIVTLTEEEYKAMNFKDPDTFYFVAGDVTE